jgi:hypothetical protein
MTPGAPIQSDAYEKLSDSVYMVYKGYFCMSRRLAAMNGFSQWTLSLLSVGLIIIPLLAVTKMTLRYEQNVIDFASIALAVAVLTFSLLIAGNNYAVRSERAHTCGLELNEILREMRFHAKDSDRMKHYQRFENSYSALLRRYENTDQIDYFQAKISIKKDEGVPWKLRCTYLAYFAKEVFLCSFALALEFGFIGFLIIAPRPHTAEPLSANAAAVVTPK